MQYNNNKKMNSERPLVKEGGLYSVSETCRLLGCHRNTLLRWTNEGLIRVHLRKKTGRKVYCGSDILRFWGGIL